MDEYDDPTGRIFFQSDRDGNPHVYSMNPDGTDLTRLTSSGGNVSPAVSPGMPPRKARS